MGLVMTVSPRFLDFEASSLSKRSYPIEVAWSDNLCNIESHLINPDCVDHWNDWDYESQKIHGIYREQCIEDGVDPNWLCDRLDTTISADEIIYTDGGYFDERWLYVLYSNGSSRGYPKFKLEHSDVVMLTLLKRVESNSKKCQQLFDELKIEARNYAGGIHRAEVDVRYLIELYKLCVSMTGI